MFIEENLHQREQSAKGMMNFFQTELSDSKRQLDEQEAKLAEFERQYIHELPEDTQTNLNLLASLDGQLEVATQALNRAQQDKTYTESLLAQQVAAWKAGQGEADQAQPPTLEQQLASLQTQVVALEVRDTPEHPDVIKLKDEIERLKKKLREQRDDARHPHRSKGPTSRADRTPTAPTIAQSASRLRRGHSRREHDPAAIAGANRTSPVTCPNESGGGATIQTNHARPSDGHGFL